jgi:predicted Zn-dependent peptidase
MTISDFRKTVPEPLPPIEFSIPGIFKAQLDNGLRIVLLEDKRLPLISYRLAFNWGDVNDPEGLTGVTSAMASMLNEGTANYSSRQLADEIERLGASISVHASDDFTILSASALSLYGSEILRLAAEIALRPTFPEDELDLYRRNTIEHLKFQRSQAGFLANEQAARLIYGTHPYARVSPSAEDIEKLTTESLRVTHEQAFIPNNAIFVIVGNFDREFIVHEINDLFGGWPKGERKSSSFAAICERDRRTLTVVDRPDSAQSNIILANSSIDRRSPDYFPMLVMNQVLGAGASSRVFMNLREDKGYTYGAYTRMDAKRLGGDFEATAEVRTTVTGESLKEFFYELDRIRDDRVPIQELQDAKNFLTGVFPIRAETQEGMTNLIVNQLLYDLPEDYLQTYREKIEAVTPEDVQRVARKYVRPQEMAIVIVGAAKEIMPQASSYAEAVEIFDTEGNPLDIVDQEAAAN